MNGVQPSVGEGDVCLLNRSEAGGGAQRLIIFIDRKKVPDLVWPFHGDSSGEIPIIYGYFGPNPEKYWPVKGYRTYLMLYRDASRLFIELIALLIY